MDSREKLLVIGLDGASFSLIRPWLDKGLLPNLAKLVEVGTSGELESTTPPVSIPAWISFATGKNPGKLGIYDLIKRKTGTYFVRPANPGSIRETTLWDILNVHDISTGIVNVPGTFPPQKVNGFIITGMLTPSDRETFTYPKRLKLELNKALGKYELDVDYWRYFDEKRFLDEIYKVTEKRQQTTEYLINTHETQVLIVVFTSLDRIQHVMWKHMDKTHPQHDPDHDNQFSDAILDYWKKLDRMIGKLIYAFEPRTTMVMSDHGFGARIGTFYVNDWLEKRGYLTLKEKARNSYFVKLGRNIEKFYYFFGKTRVYQLLSNLLYKLLGRETIYRIIFRYLSIERMIDAINWEKTRAFSCPHSIHFGQIYINLQDRESHGCVSPSEYNMVRDQIITDLNQLKNPITGKKFTLEIFKPEEIYSGPYVHQAPDIIFSINDGEYEADTSFGHNSLFLQGSFDLRCTGTHYKKGILIVAGPEINEGVEISNAKITDIAPTILHYFGVPIPQSMDGRVLKEIFKEDSIQAKRAVKFSEKQIGENEEFGFSKEDESKIKERLRNLGYIS